MVVPIFQQSQLFDIFYSWNAHYDHNFRHFQLFLTIYLNHLDTGVLQYRKIVNSKLFESVRYNYRCVDIIPMGYYLVRSINNETMFMFPKKFFQFCSCLFDPVVCSALYMK